MGGTEDSAVVAGADGAAYNDLLTRVHAAAVHGATSPARPRAVIADSWRRLLQRGVRPDRNSALPSPAADTDVSAMLRAVIADIAPHLQPLVDDGSAVAVVADAEGRIVHTAGFGAIRRDAADIGFDEGNLWTEPLAGTNAVGTTLVTRQPVAVHGAEHFLVNQHGWSCAAAPVRDPWTGGLLGAIDVSVRVDQAHPALLPLASSLARTASLELAARHRASLERLRTAALAATRGLHDPWAVIDRWGWVADTHRMDARVRLALPGPLTPGEHWIPPIGTVQVDPLGEGWLLRAAGSEPRLQPTLVEIQPGASGAHVWLVSGEHRRSVDVTPRQAEILVLLAGASSGLTAAELSARLYGTPERDVTVRAEISRLRRSLGGLIVAAPYRYAPGVVASVTP